MPSSRDDIGLATCKRLLTVGSEIQGARTAEQAAKEAQKAVMSVLEKGGAEAAELLKLTKTKTVTLDIVRACFVGKCLGVRDADLSSAPRKGKGQRGLPLAGVERIFRMKLADSSRITDDAKKALVGVAEAYLRSLGHNAGLMAKAGKRNTIQAADILAARKLSA